MSLLALNTSYLISTIITSIRVDIGKYNKLAVSNMAILLLAILSMCTHTVIGSALTTSSDLSSLKQSGESDFQEKHDQASLPVFSPSPLVLRLQQYRETRIDHLEFSELSNRGKHDHNSFRRLFYSRPRQKRDTGKDAGSVNTEDEEEDTGKKQKDYDYVDGKGGSKEISRKLSGQTTFDDSITWPKDYPGCDPQQNPYTSPVDISTADIVRVKNTQTLLVFSDQPKPDTYILSTMHESEGVRLEAFSIRLNNDDVVRDATHISGLGTLDHRFFDSAVFFIRPQETQNSTAKTLPPSRRAHTIDMYNFPMEIMFTFKTNLGQGITQIHVMVEITEEENPIWRPILTMFKPLIENVIHKKCFGAETAQQLKDELDFTSKTYKKMIYKQKKEREGSTYREYYDELEELYDFLQSANEDILAGINTRLEISRNSTETCQHLLDESSSKIAELEKSSNNLQKSLENVVDDMQKAFENAAIELNMPLTPRVSVRKPKGKKTYDFPAFDIKKSGNRRKRETTDNDATNNTNHKGTQPNVSNAQPEDVPANNANSNQAVTSSEAGPSDNATSNQPVATSDGGSRNNANSNQAVTSSEAGPSDNANSNQPVAPSDGGPTINQFNVNSNQTSDDISSNSSQEASTTPAYDPMAEFEAKVEALTQEKHRLENVLHEETTLLGNLKQQQSSFKKCIQDMTYNTITIEEELQKLVILRKYYRIGSGSNALFPSVAAVKEEMEKTKSNSETLDTLKKAYEDELAQYDSFISSQRRSITLRDPFHISWLFPARGGHYFYNGSSPIPPCNERPYVIVFEDRITISEKQLDLFHRFPATEQTDEEAWNNLCGDRFETTDEKLLYVEGMDNMKNQVPKITPLGHRTIWYNARNLQYKGDDGVHMLSRKRLLKKGKPSKPKKP